MTTFLFDDIIFGPVTSRRLGASLGINLLPSNRKFCNFNCIYCECGWSSGSNLKIRLPLREEIRNRLEEKLLQIQSNGTRLDRITFAGNGEPTIHPDFPDIIADTISIRDQIVPGVKIAVLSNASRLGNPEIFDALGRIEMNILKLDSANEHTVQLMNQPPSDYRIDHVIEGMMRFKGRFILQTLFVKGEFGGMQVDNTTEEEVKNWLEVVKTVTPEMVMIYTIARDTPIQTLRKIKSEILDNIAGEVIKLGIPVQVSY
ncbi:MAG: radical SAM protein [Bacteroidia bacterium]|nr:radical SAM protein [Bacteroidia bacterium]